MKKFRFKLEGILKIRREEERQREAEVQRIQALIRDVVLRMNQIASEQNQWRKSHDEVENHAWIQMIEQYLLALEHEAKYQTQTLSDLETELLDAQEKLKEAYKARRQVEHLKDKQKSEYIKALNKMIEKEMSEMTILRFAHDKLNDRKEGSA